MIPPSPTGLPAVDRIADLEEPSLGDYVAAASEYVLRYPNLDAGPAKAAQLALSPALGRALLTDLRERVPSLVGVAGEHNVAGALRNVNADVSEFHTLDGLRLAVEIKPVYNAVGRAIWNRFGDIRTFAVNLHLKFPFAVIGGVLAIPTYELTRQGERKDTTHLISRAVDRLVRAGGRMTEGDAAHLLEGVGVLVFDPESASLDPGLPPVGSGLRWDEFLSALATAYEARFGAI